jgi:hypothetical protein
MSDGHIAGSNNMTVTVVRTNCGGVHPSSFEALAGPDLTNSTESTLTLFGSVKRDGTSVQPPAVSVMWSNATPAVGSVWFETNLPVTRASFSRAGTYTIKIWAKEATGQMREDSDPAYIHITNGPVTGCTLTVSAGSYPPLQRPTGSTAPVCVTLSGLTFTNGIPATVPVEWSVPSGVTLDNPRVPRPRACFSRTGDFVLWLRGTACGGSVSNSVTVKVTDAPCRTLAVNAGGDRTLFLDDTSGGLSSPAEVCTMLSGSVNPAGGATIRWSRVSGPGTVSFTTPNSTNTQVCFTAVGTNVLRLAASVGTCTNWSDVVVTVKHAAKHYVTWRIPTTPEFCCGTTYVFKNSHRHCPIRAVIQPTRCIQMSIDPPPVTITLEPSPSGLEQAICTGGSFSIVSAEFLCSDPDAPLTARLQLPPARDLQRFGFAPEAGVDSDLLRAASVGDGNSSSVLEFLLFGAAGQGYLVEASSDLTNWFPIAAVTASDDPVWVRDSEAGGPQRRFYRAVPR